MLFNVSFATTDATFENVTNTSASSIQIPVIVSIWSLSALLDLLILFLVHKSKSSLIRVEFLILIALESIGLFIKITIILGYLEARVSFGSIYSICLRIFNLIIQLIYSFILFYYSLFHLATIDRSSCFRKLFDLVHNSRTFCIYMMSITLFAIIFIIGYLLVFFWIENANNRFDNLIETIVRASMYLMVYVSIWFTAPPLVCYLISMLVVYLGHLRSVHRKYADKNNDADKQQQLRSTTRTFKVLLKFSILAVNNIMSNVPVLVYYFLKLACNCSNYQYLSFVGDFFYLMCPVFLILIHEILKKTCFNILKRN